MTPCLNKARALARSRASVAALVVLAAVGAAVGRWARGGGSAACGSMVTSGTLVAVLSGAAQLRVATPAAMAISRSKSLPRM